MGLVDCILSTGVVGETPRSSVVLAPPSPQVPEITPAVGFVGHCVHSMAASVPGRLA